MCPQKFVCSFCEEQKLATARKLTEMRNTLEMNRCSKSPQVTITNPFKVVMKWKFSLFSKSILLQKIHPCVSLMYATLFQSFSQLKHRSFLTVYLKLAFRSASIQSATNIYNQAPPYIFTFCLNVHRYSRKDLSLLVTLQL